ncbi:hypothetical protein TYRP_011444 [Tyrophagus putrescentiae]|nr:hypothetical protein TYRP_011444 [Tyrophagus putrescentiae]
MAQEAPVVGTSVQAAPVAPEAFSGSLWVLLLEVLLQQGTVAEKLTCWRRQRSVAMHRWAMPCADKRCCLMRSGFRANSQHSSRGHLTKKTRKQKGLLEIAGHLFSSSSRRSRSGWLWW